MCGVVGKITLSDKAVESAAIVRMRDALSHRGPDDAGIYISPDHHVGLGHRRLSIIDTSSSGHQPMSFLDRYWIVFNGEVYNFASLRQQLGADGYKFQSHTDTEIILALYDNYKNDCVRHLRGMFAFAIYDEQEQILFCARDRAGQKPFKYFYDGRTFLFASELKAILTQPEYKPAIDELAIHNYLTYQFVPAPQTGFQDIHKLLPGHTLTLDLQQKKLEMKRYWQLDFSHPEIHSESEWTKLISNKFDEAVVSQMVADVPLGAFLSGGIDSSAVVAHMARHSANPIKTFSIGFPEEAYSELSYAQQVASHFKTDHTEFVVKPEAIDIWPELVTAFEEPYADSSAIPTYYLSKLTRQHVTVALTGDGGDENFAGYARYNFHKLALLLDAWKINKLPWSRLAPLARHIQTTLGMRAERFLESLSEPTMRRYVTYMCYFTNTMKNDLYQPAWQQRFATTNSYDVIQSLTAESGASPFNQALYADIASYLPDDLLVKVDIASMMTSLEARSPFLDHEFMELAAHIPAHLKLKGLRQNKYILKKTFQNILPPTILNRPKMGFIVPIEKWFRGDMQKYLQSMLLSPQTRITQHMFRREAIQKLLARHTATKTNVAPPLWALLTLELWLRRYFP